MPSFNNPQPTNAILDDIVDIRELLRLNVKWDPTSAADIPAGAKRLVEVTGGWQIQIYDGAAWASIGKLMHGSGSIDGYTVSTSAKAGCIPVYNANAQLVGSITGNAATATKLATARSIDIGGIATADAQSFNGTANITIPITRITVNNDNDDALNGEVSKLHGGTGRTDGAAADVIVDSLAGNVKASEYGQIGRAKQISATTSLDSLVVPGVYKGVNKGTLENGYPLTIDLTPFIHVEEAGGYVIQHFKTFNFLFVRRSSDRGASWGSWAFLGGTISSTINIYISKSGAANNTGLESAYPTNSITSAISLARRITSPSSSAQVFLRVGAGDWGDVTLESLPFNLLISPYDGAAPTEYSDELPKFGSLTVYDSRVRIMGIVASKVRAEAGAMIQSLKSFNRFRVSAVNGGYFQFESSGDAGNILEIPSFNGDTFGIESQQYSCVYFGYINIRFAGASTATALMGAGNGGLIRAIKDGTLFDANGYTFTGKKYQLWEGGSLHVFGDKKDGTLPDWLSTIPGTLSGSTDDTCVINGYPLGAAIDSKVVHLAGEETITGAKTFTSQFLTVSANTPRVMLKDPSFSKGNAGVSGKNSAIQFSANVASDGTGNGILGQIQQILDTSGGNTVSVIAMQNHKDKSWEGARIEVFCSADGATQYATAPKPPDGDSSTKIATTNWVKNNVTTVSPATAAPKALGTAAVGSSAKYAREDHVHPLPSKFQDNAITTIRAIEFGGAGTGEGGLIDFHWGGTTADYTSRIIESSSGILTVNGLAISDGYASAKLRSKGSRSTDGTWSITGCTIGAPLLILHKGGSGTSTGTSVQMYVSSGGTGGNRSYGRYMLGTSTNEADMHGNVFVTIPTATTVNISVTGCADDGDVLYAYQ